jgi:hypothetical protein
MINVEFNHLKRDRRSVRRPKRNGSEISRHDAFRVRIASIARVTTVTVVFKGCISTLSDTFLEL